MSWKAEVSKPSRYIGGEVGQVVKDASGLVGRMALAFPDVYEVAASHLGFQILYHSVNAQSDLAAERVYAPWLDAGKSLSSRGIELHTLETGTAVRRFDVLGFSMPYELLITGVLYMLELAGIALRAAGREEDDPIVIGGGPALVNPEPYAVFFDAVVIGDGELSAVEILRTVGRARKDKASRRGILELLAGLNGVYVPSLYEAAHEGARPIENAPQAIKRLVLPNLDEHAFRGTPLVPLGKVVHDRLSVEVFRGCTRGCRFCQAGYIYRPVRERSADDLLDQIERQLDAGGFEELGLLSLSTGDYTDLDRLLQGVLNYTTCRRIGTSLPSLRVESLSPNIIEAVQRVHKTGFTIALEAGSERLRNSLNKPISTDEIMAVVQRVFEAGWSQIKLYFMIGLPGETDEDIDAIVDLTDKVMSRIRSIRRGGSLNLHISTFVPKPHTPFQWEPMIPLDRAWRTIARIRRSFRSSRVKVRWQEPKTSQVEAALARGGRETAKAILRAYERGARFDAWTEQFNHRLWVKGFADAGLDLAQAAEKELDRKSGLPWEHIDIGVTREFLLSELDAASKGELTPDCRDGPCTDCGVCTEGVEVRLAKHIREDIETGRKAPEYGAVLDQPPVVQRVRVNFRKTGDAMYIGHLELISVVERAMRRSGLPIAFSMGHHPKPKLSFGPPLAIGIESLDEYFDVQLVQRLDTGRIAQMLAGNMAHGIVVKGVQQVPIRSDSLFEAVSGFTYEFTLAEEPGTGVARETLEHVKQAVDAFTRAEKHIVERKRQKTSQLLDLKKFVRRIGLLGDTGLQLDIEHLPGKPTVKPTTVLSSILGWKGSDVLRRTLVKTETRFRNTEEDG